MISSRFPTVPRTLLVVVGLAACGAEQEAVSEQLVEQAAGEDVDLELGVDGQVMSVETEDGSMAINASGDASEEWPDDVPLFEDGVVGNSQVLTSDGEMYVGVDFTTDTDAESAFEAKAAAYDRPVSRPRARRDWGDATEVSGPTPASVISAAVRIRDIRRRLAHHCVRQCDPPRRLIMEGCRLSRVGRNYSLAWPSRRCTMAT